MQAVGLVDGVPGLVPENAPAFGLARTFDLQHLAALEPHQARMGEIEGNGEPEHAVGIEKLLRQPGMRQRDDVVRLQFAMQPPHPARHQGAVQLQRQIAQARRQQGLVGCALQHERGGARLADVPVRRGVMAHLSPVEVAHGSLWLQTRMPFHHHGIAIEDRTLRRS